MWLLGLMHLVLSLGDVNALIPIIIILILIVAAGGLTRGFDIFSMFGLAALTGIGLGNRASMARKSAYDPRQPADFRSSSTSGVNAAEAKKIREQLKNKQISRREAYKKLGAVAGTAGGAPSLAAGAYKTYKTFAGKEAMSKEQTDNFLSSGSPIVLAGTANNSNKKSKTPTLRQINDQIANRVRMSVLSEPTNFKPRKNVPETPFSQGTKNPAFSTIENAVAWSLSSHDNGGASRKTWTGGPFGKWRQKVPTMADKLRTKEMRRLAAEDPAAFNRRYKNLARVELHKHQFSKAQEENNMELATALATKEFVSKYGKGKIDPNDERFKTLEANYLKQVNERHPIFKIPANDEERMRLGYTKTIYKEWGRGMKRNFNTRKQGRSFSYSAGSKSFKVTGKKDFITGESEHNIHFFDKKVKLGKKKKA